MKSEKLISADELRAWLKKIPLHDLSNGLGFCRVIFADDFERVMKSFPGEAIDVEPVVHARWIYRSDCGVTECSACHRSVEEYVEYPHCMFCGAFMDGEQKKGWKRYFRKSKNES